MEKMRLWFAWYPGESKPALEFFDRLRRLGIPEEVGVDRNFVHVYVPDPDRATEIIRNYLENYVADNYRQGRGELNPASYGLEEFERDWSEWYSEDGMDIKEIMEV